MNTIDILHSRLLKAKEQFAVEALTKPTGKDGFAYGYAVGVMAGYQASIAMLENSLKEEKDFGQDL